MNSRFTVHIGLHPHGQDLGETQVYLFIHKIIFEDLLRARHYCFKTLFIGGDKT